MAFSVRAISSTPASVSRWSLSHDKVNFTGSAPRFEDAAARRPPPPTHLHPQAHQRSGEAKPPEAAPGV